MQHINELVGKLYQSEQTEQQTKRSVQDHNPEFLKAVLTSLTIMGLINSPDREVYQIWGSGLADFSEGQIKRALIKARDFRGFFNLPAFREMCRIKPEDMGLPDTKKAYIEACMAPSPKAKHKWSHPAVYHAGKATGWFELATFPEDQIYTRFQAFYAEMCDRVMQGEKLDSPVMEALPEKVTVILTPEENEDRMAKLRGSLGI
jgi:hypothetical protein